MQKAQGMTLIELLAVLTIASILFGVGLPAMENLVRNSAARSAAFEMQTHINWTRNEASLVGQRVALCRSGNAMAPGIPKCDTGTADTAHDGYEDGWIVFIDEARNWQPQQETDILRRYGGLTTGGVTIRGQAKGNNADHIAFTPLGLSAGTTGTLVVCDARGWALNGHWAHILVMSSEGRVRDVPGDSPGLSVNSCTP